jgi:hypothetical protein
VTGGITCSFPAARLDLVLAAGTYFVEVSDNGNNQSGGYVLLYQPIVGPVPALEPDVPISDAISPVGDLDLFTFTLTTQQRVVLQATQTGIPAAIDPCLRVLTGASGPPVTGGITCSFPAARLDLVLAAGTYFVEVSDNGNNQSGGYNLLYQPSSQVPLPANAPYSDTISPVGDLDLFYVFADSGLNTAGTYTVLVQCSGDSGTAANDAFTINQDKTFASAALGVAPNGTIPILRVATGTITGDMPATPLIAAATALDMPHSNNPANLT